MMRTKSAAVRWGGVAVFALTAALVAGHEVLGARQSTMAADSKEHPYVIEYYYKAKWGHAEEFLALFKKNHYPVLKKEMELGRMLKVSMVTPRYHMTEDSRWDYRVTIVFKNASIANDNFDSSALIKQLYPDQETYKKEEQRRFEILEAHWDLPIKDVDLDAR
jgi:TRAP-type mannitol/chloroaromatic compound transport system substrate-binding protein